MRHKAWAVFFVLILFSTIQGLIMSLEVNALIKPDRIIKILAEAKIYQNLPETLKSIGEDSLRTSENQAANLQSKILLDAIAASLEPAVAKKEVEKNIYSFNEYLRGKKPLVGVNFDLISFKETIIQKLPSVINENTSGTNAGQIPTEVLTQEIAKSIPASYNLAQMPDAEKTFGKIKLFYKLIVFSPWVLGGLSLFLLLVLTYWARGSAKTIFKWWGVSLLLPSGSYLILTVLSKFLNDFSKTYTYAQIGATINPKIIDTIMLVFDAINRHSLPTAYLYSGIIAAIGGLLLIFSIFLPKPAPLPPK